VRYELGFYIPEDDILHSQRRETHKFYSALTGRTLYWRRNVSPVRYELGFYIPEDDILHSHSRENLKSYIAATSTLMVGSRGDQPNIRSPKRRFWKNQNLERKVTTFCYHSIQNLLSPCLLPKNVKVRIYKTIILPAASIIHTTFWRRGQVRASRILGLEIWVRNDAVSNGERYGSPWQ
jgi:hypothetical protein